jgi:hypothetical protein
LSLVPLDDQALLIHQGETFGSLFDHRAEFGLAGPQFLFRR